jgi:hypothetical protein
LIATHHDRYPALATAIKAGAFIEGATKGPDFGLECILDGIDAFIRRKKRKRTREKGFRKSEIT